MTQSSLINAAKESSYGSAPAQKKTSAAAKKTGSAASAKKTGSAAKKEEPALTSAEKKLVELYRAADAETKKKAVAVLKGEQTDAGDILTTLLGSAMDMFGKK